MIYPVYFFEFREDDVVELWAWLYIRIERVLLIKMRDGGSLTWKSFSYATFVFGITEVQVI